MNGKVVAIIVAVLVVIAIGWYVAQERGEPETSAVVEEPAWQQPPAPAPGGEVGVVEREPIPPAPQVAVPPPERLEESDEVVRSAAADLAVKLAAWMKPEEQVRKWVLLVDMAADGKVPARNRPLSYPMSAFKVAPAQAEDRFRFDEANYGRANDLVQVLVGIPPQKAAEYYHAWRPLLEEAYAELGKPDSSFDQRLRAAIERVLAVAPLEAAPELARPNVFYTYADPAREKASDLEKLLWRLGPDNLARLQNYLREVQAQL